MESFIENNWTWMLVIYLWSLTWKGWALWRAAGQKDKVWFIALLIVNTIGILEVFYIFYFSKQSQKEHSQVPVD
ncbi:hypothetical protein DYH10_00205 [Candidatus Saccharibacteria bacterium CPR2]|nr:hypothetical protein [Candidatus Saccharibacteria bacterium CPR2]